MTVWNSADKHANITLSESDIRASMTTGSALGVRATTSKSSGKWCWELDTIIRSVRILFGFATSAQVLTNYVGSSTASWAFWPEDSKFYYNNVPTVTASTGHNSGDVFTAAVDFDAGSISLWRNGVFVDTKYSNVAGTLFPMVSFYTAPSVRGRFKAHQFIYPVPAGYTAWDDIPGEQRVLRADGKAVSVPEGYMVGRPVSENVRGLSPGEARTLIALGALATLNSVGTSQIDNSAVTLAKQADLTQGRAIGRAAGAGTGVPTSLTEAQQAANILTAASAVGWTAPTLLNSWVNFGSPNPTAGYRKDPATGIVYLRGFLKDGTTTTNTVLFNLPAGFRPAMNLFFSMNSSGGNDRLQVQTGGDVIINGSSIGNAHLVVSAAFPTA